MGLFSCFAAAEKPATARKYSCSDIAENADVFTKVRAVCIVLANPQCPADVEEGEEMQSCPQTNTGFPLLIAC